MTQSHKTPLTCPYCSELVNIEEVNSEPRIVCWSCEVFWKENGWPC